MKAPFFFLLLLIFFTRCSPPANQNFQNFIQKNGKEFSILIQNGNILNGLDTLAVQSDVLLQNDQIVYIGKVDTTQIQLEKIINAKGKYVSPGFIDAHAHGDPLTKPQFNNFLAMGVTTICLGQDGSSPNTQHIENWMQQVQDTLPAVNIAMFVGHGTLRKLSGIHFKPQPTADELSKMKQLLQNALDAGCFGMTTGLEYTPGTYAQAEELNELAKVVGQNNALIMSHIRNEDDDAIETSLKELLEQGQYCNVQVSHIKVVYGKGKKRAQEILELLAKSRKGKYRVTADIYPYNASYTGIGIVFPQWAKPPNDFQKVAKERRNELLSFLKKKVESRNGPEATLFGTAPYRAKTLKEVSDELGKTFEEVLLEDIGPQGASAAYFVMNDSLQTHLLLDENVMLCSDGSPTMHHPRGYGSFAKMIEEYAIKRQALSLGEAVRKMTALPAAVIGLQDRGTLEVGKKADVLIFDAKKVKAKATYAQPQQLAEGFEAVIINGKLAMENGNFLNRNGRVLKKN